MIGRLPESPSAFSAVADAGFAVDLDSILGGMIARRPLLFLEELKRNRTWVPDLPTSS